VLLFAATKSACCNDNLLVSDTLLAEVLYNAVMLLTLLRSKGAGSPLAIKTICVV